MIVGVRGLGLLPPFAALATSCAVGAAPAAWVHPTPAEWAEACAALRALRDDAPRSPYVVTMSTTLSDPRTGRAIDGRGAMAVAPGVAVRMILVGPAGATLMDAWITPRRWRIAVPPIDLVRRGGSEDPPGLPVGFLRWWFFEPLEGTLFAASFRGGDKLWLVRRGGAVVELLLRACAGDGRSLEAIRRSGGRTEAVTERERGCGAGFHLVPSAGDTVDYRDGSSGLAVEIHVESVGAAPPGGEAFEDPEASATAPTPPAL